LSESEREFKAITGNRLRTGAVVYLSRLSPRLAWSTDVKDSMVFDETEVEDALARAQVDVVSNNVVGVYAFEVIDNHKALSAREKIRASGGPTIRYGQDATRQEPDYSI
jgi:hypothetical protein